MPQWKAVDEFVYTTGPEERLVGVAYRATVRGPEDDANAKLWAAAPELANALEAARREIESLTRRLLALDECANLDTAEMVSLEVEAALRAAGRLPTGSGSGLSLDSGTTGGAGGVMARCMCRPGRIHLLCPACGPL